MKKNELKDFVLSAFVGEELSSRDVFSFISKKTDQFSFKKVSGMIGYLVSVNILKRTASSTFVRTEPPNADEELVAFFENLTEENQIYLQSMMEQMLDLMKSVCSAHEELFELKTELLKVQSEKELWFNKIKDLHSLINGYAN